MKLWKAGYFRNVGATYLQMGIGVIAQLLLVPFYIRHLGESRSGILIMLLSIQNFMAFGVNWFSIGLGRKLGEAWADRDPKIFSRHFYFGKKLFRCYAAAAAVFSGVLLLLWRQGLEYDLSLSAVLGYTAYLFLVFETGAERSALLAMGRQDLSSMSLILTNVIYLGATLCLLGSRPDLSIPTWSLACGGFVAWIFLRIVLHSKIASPEVGETRGSWTEHLRSVDAVPFLVYGVLLAVFQADYFVVGIGFGPDFALALTLLWKPAEFAAQVVWRVSDVAAPHWVIDCRQGNFRKLRSGMRRADFISLFLGLAFLLVYGMAGPVLTRLWVGDRAPEFHSWYYWAAGAAMLALSIAHVSAVANYSIGNVRALNILVLVEWVTKWALAWPLIARFGAPGLLLAIVLQHVLGIGWVYRFLKSKSVRTVSVRERSVSEVPI